MRRILLLSVVCLFGLFLLLTSFIAWYYHHIQSSAVTLAREATAIRATSDVGAAIQRLRQLKAIEAWDEASSAKTGAAYGFRVTNGLIAGVGIAPRTEMTLVIDMRGDQLNSVILTMFTETGRSFPVGVWVQQWAAGDQANSDSVRVQRHADQFGRPTTVIVDLGAAAPARVRDLAFRIDPQCLVRRSGCKTPEKILPDLDKVIAEAMAPVKQAVRSSSPAFRQ